MPPEQYRLGIDGVWSYRWLILLPAVLGLVLVSYLGSIGILSSCFLGAAIGNGLVRAIF